VNRRFRINSCVVFVLLGAAIALRTDLLAQSALTPYQQLARDLLKELVEVNTTHATGTTSKGRMEWQRA
jgi:hypothetical protein